jgi:surface antigen
VVPQGNVQQGSVQQGEAQRGRGAQQRGLQEGNAPQGNVQQGRVQQGNERSNPYGQRDNGQYGNTYGSRDNSQYGNTYGPRDYYGPGNNGQYGNGYGPRDNGQYGNNNGRNFDQNEFNRHYYGRYGSDPGNFQRNRQIYRTQQRWRERYPHDYVYADDSFYRDCRTNNQVGGAVVGAILGGLLGNSLSQGQGRATLAGIILGGAGGAALAGNLDCEDRSYVYPTYYEGFERGRREASYPWRNDRTGHYGTLLVGDYYRDQDNYRCATYTQTIYVRGAPRTARGHACRQDDGTWALID